MNKAFIVGRLTRPPEARTTPNGVSVTTFTVAVTRRMNREEADFLNDDQYGYYLTGNVTADQKAKFFSSLKEKNIKVYSLYEVY